MSKIKADIPLSELSVGDLRLIILEVLEHRELLIKQGRKPLKGLSAIAQSLGMNVKRLSELRRAGVFHGVILQNCRIITAYEDELQARYIDYSSGRYKPLPPSKRIQHGHI